VVRELPFNDCSDMGERDKPGCYKHIHPARDVRPALDLMKAKHSPALSLGEPTRYNLSSI
jgi:hypothetical protein